MGPRLGRRVLYLALIHWQAPAIIMYILMFAMHVRAELPVRILVFPRVVDTDTSVLLSAALAAPRRLGNPTCACGTWRVWASCLIRRALPALWPVSGWRVACDGFFILSLPSSLARPPHCTPHCIHERGSAQQASILTADSDMHGPRRVSVSPCSLLDFDFFRRVAGGSPGASFLT